MYFIVTGWAKYSRDEQELGLVIAESYKAASEILGLEPLKAKTRYAQYYLKHPFFRDTEGGTCVLSEVSLLAGRKTRQFTNETYYTVDRFTISGAYESQIGIVAGRDMKAVRCKLALRILPIWHDLRIFCGTYRSQAESNICDKRDRLYAFLPIRKLHGPLVVPKT